MHLAPIIHDLAIILAIAGLMNFLFKKINQPVVLGYLLAGFLIGPYTLPQLIADKPNVHTFAELGVIFLMFTLGLEFSFRKLVQVGFSAFMTATVEVLFFFVGGYWFGKFLGWTQMECIFLGCMLSMSSTTIIIKAMDELNLKKRKFAQLIFGSLIVEDLYGILMMVGLATMAQEKTLNIANLSMSALKLFFVVSIWFVVGFFLVPRFMKHVNKVSNHETVTIISLGFCLALVLFAAEMGYSTALGAFIMGSILAETTLIHQIEQRMEPIKDLFGAIFFVSIGMLIDPRVLAENWQIIASLTLFTVFGKVFSTSLGSLLSGQTPTTSLQVGMGMAQIGEFSFIIANVGMALKVISPDIYPIIVAVSSVTTFTTPYFIKYSIPLGQKVEKSLPQKVSIALNRYSLWIEHTKTQLQKHEYIGRIAFKWLINGLVMTLIFLLSHQYLGRSIKGYGVHLYLVPLVLSLPFIWAMLFGHKKILQRQKFEEKNKLPLLLSPLITLVWISALSALYFPIRFVLPVTVVFLSVFIFLTYKKLESYYHWFEKSFLDNFSETDDEQDIKSTKAYEHLAPWDIHLTNIQVHPNSVHVQKRLIDAQLRAKYGINIIAIKRGIADIVAPGPMDTILPGDELVILGNDEQIDAIRKEIELPCIIATETTGTDEYELRYISLTDLPLLNGKQISESNIREKYLSLIVGIERTGQRIINPDTKTTLQLEDKLWVVGNRKNIELLLKENS